LNLATLTDQGHPDGLPAPIDRTVYSQFQRGAFGIHMAVSEGWKYIYSAYEDREFLFDRSQDPHETVNCAASSFRQAELQHMRTRLIKHYQADGYEEPLGGQSWRQFEPPSLREYPGFGLAPRDCPMAVPHLPIPGYSD
jgi:hypothetical protein